MKIGVFSKLEMAGGSEFRCAEMANAITRYSEHEAFLLAERDIPPRIDAVLEKDVTRYRNIFLPQPDNIDVLYEMDCILIINTDCKAFTHADYWLGKSERHGHNLDLSRLKQLVFLFNFLVSPSRHLHTIAEYVPDVRVIATNTKFFNEISNQDRYEQMRHLPRTILESPIDPHKFSTIKTPSKIIRFGMHSKTPSNKWNREWAKLINKCNERLDGRISFDFMQMNNDVARYLDKFNNVTLRKEDSIPVSEFLTNIDVFTFFPSWDREEPWSRAIGEAMTSGCPILATDKGGNRDQVINGNNGYLCKNLDRFFKYIVELTEKPDRIAQMRKNSLRFAKHFSSENIAHRFIDFIQ